MEEEKPRKKNVFNLILGIAFLGYGGFRLITYLNGTHYSTFRFLIAIGFVVLGAIDLYKYYKAGN